MTEKKTKNKSGKGKKQHYSLRQAVEQRLLYDASLVAPATHDVGTPPAEGAAAQDATQAPQAEAKEVAKGNVDSATHPVDRNPADTTPRDSKTFTEELKARDST